MVTRIQSGWCVWLCSAIVFVTGNVAFGGPFLWVMETWTGSDLNGWTNAAPVGTGDADLSNPGDYLEISFGAQSGPPVFEEEIVYTTSSTYTGAVSSLENAVLGFSFYSEDVLPLLSEVMFHSGVSGRTWEYVFTTVAVGVWDFQTVAFDPNSWTGSGTAADFLADLASVDWIGIYVARASDTSQQDFGIDNWMYYVIPEPATVAFLATMGASLFACRRRLGLTVA